MARFFKCLQILLPAMPQALQRDADDTLTMYIPNLVKKVVLYGKTVVKLHFTFRVMNCGLLKLNIYSWYSCTLVVLKNQCLIYYGYPFFDNAFFSYHFVYIDNVLFCVSNISLVTPTSIEYANFFAHAEEIGWILISMSRAHAHWVTFAHGIEQNIHRYLGK